jgi:DNA-damage-inducible protein J
VAVKIPSRTSVSAALKSESTPYSDTDIPMLSSPETKRESEKLYSSFGLTLSDAITMFLHQSLAIGGLPFELRQPRYNAETEAAMQEARDIMSGKISAKTYHSAKALSEELDAEDESGD